MNNYTEHTWTLVTFNAEVKKLMQSYIKYPPRKAQSETYTGPITISAYQRFQWVRDKLQQEGTRSAPAHGKLSRSRKRTVSLWGRRFRTRPWSDRPQRASMSVVSRRTMLFGVAAFASISGARFAISADTPPLASWNDGAAKQAILDFVKTTADPASPNFVPPEARIATFDQDGTLWVEHPIYSQVIFCLDRVPGRGEGESRSLRTSSRSRPCSRAIARRLGKLYNR